MPEDQSVVPWKSALVTFFSFLVLGGLPMLPYVFSWEKFKVEPPIFVHGTKGVAVSLLNTRFRSHLLDFNWHLHCVSLRTGRVESIPHWQTLVAWRCDHDDDRSGDHRVCGPCRSVSHQVDKEAPS